MTKIISFAILVALAAVGSAPAPTTQPLMEETYLAGMMEDGALLREEPAPQIPLASETKDIAMMEGGALLYDQPTLPFILKTDRG